MNRSSFAWAPGILVFAAIATGCEAVSSDDAELIRQAEHRRLQALVEADMEVANVLHADDFRLINPSGLESTKEQYLGNVAAGNTDYLVWEPGPIEVRVSGDSAVIRYKSDLHIVLRGADLGLRPHWHTDYYERRDGVWQVVWSHATVIQP